MTPDQFLKDAFALLNTVAQPFLELVLTFVALLLTKWAAEHLPAIRAKIVAELNEERFSVIRQAADFGFEVTEQLKKNGTISKVSAEAKAHAIKIAQAYLDERGIKVDAELLAAHIESKVFENNAWNK